MEPTRYFVDFIPTNGGRFVFNRQAQLGEEGVVTWQLDTPGNETTPWPGKRAAFGFLSAYGAVSYVTAEQALREVLRQFSEQQIRSANTYHALLSEHGIDVSTIMERVKRKWAETILTSDIRYAMLCAVSISDYAAIIRELHEKNTRLSKSNA